MNRYSRLFLLAILFQVAAVAGFGQDGSPGGFPVGPMNSPPDRPQRPLVPATVVKPGFAVNARILTEDWVYKGNHEYKGEGTMRLVEGPDRQLSYRYTCAYRFQARSATYPARWIEPGKKIRILMSKPGSSHATGCTLSIQN